MASTVIGTVKKFAGNDQSQRVSLYDLSDDAMITVTKETRIGEILTEKESVEITAGEYKKMLLQVVDFFVVDPDDDAKD